MPLTWCPRCGPARGPTRVPRSPRSGRPRASRPSSRAMKPAEERALAGIRAELSRVIRYDDESIVNRVWIMQRYDCGCFPGLARARRATVETAWHEAGHAVAALALGARFSSVSIRHACGQEGRVHGVTGAADRAFVIDAAGQIAQRLRNWTMLERDDELRAWLPTWKS